VDTEVTNQEFTKYAILTTIAMVMIFAGAAMTLTVQSVKAIAFPEPLRNATAQNATVAGGKAMIPILFVMDAVMQPK